MSHERCLARADETLAPLRGLADAATAFDPHRLRARARPGVSTSMNRLEAALLDISGYLEGERIPHMVIGGFANLRWGRPRLTEDLDLKVQMAEPSWSSFV